MALHIANTQITDLEPLSSLHNLVALHIANTKITNLETLSKFKKLRILDISETKIFDLRPLKELHNLEFLRIRKTEIIVQDKNFLSQIIFDIEVSDEDNEIEKFKKEHPNCRVERY